MVLALIAQVLMALALMAQVDGWHQVYRERAVGGDSGGCLGRRLRVFGVNLLRQKEAIDAISVAYPLYSDDALVAYPLYSDDIPVVYLCTEITTGTATGQLWRGPREGRKFVSCDVCIGEASHQWHLSFGRALE